MKNLLGFSFYINIGNFEAFLRNLNLSTNCLFWRCVVSIKVNKSLDVTCNNLLIADLIIIQTCTYVCKYVYLYFVQVHSYLMYAFAYDVFKPPGTRAQNTTRLWWYVLLCNCNALLSNILLHTIHQNQINTQIDLSL